MSTDDVAVSAFVPDATWAGALAVEALAELVPEGGLLLLHAVQTPAVSKLTVNSPNVATGRFTSCLSLDKWFEFAKGFREHF
jgi:hypothetical protein